MTSKRHIAALIIVSLLAAIAAGQKNPKAPEVATPVTFRGSEITSAIDQTSIGDLKWFDVFKDEELQKLVRTAMDQNYDLRDRELFDAELNLAQTNRNELLSLVQLYKALGGGWQQ